MSSFSTIPGTCYSNLFETRSTLLPEIEEDYPFALAAIDNAKHWTANLIRENPTEFLSAIKRQPLSNFISESTALIYKALDQEHVMYSNLDLPLEIHKFPNGDEFQGDLKNGKPHGIGIYRFVNGDLSAGHFVNGKLQGKGIYKLIDGSLYAGDFFDDRPHGKLLEKIAYGRVYIANCLDGERHGENILISSTPPFLQTLQMHHGSVIHVDRSNIKDIYFLCLLFNIPLGGADPGYFLGVISDYLMHYFKDNEQILNTVVLPLVWAPLFSSTNSTDESRIISMILHGLNDKRPYLLPYGTFNHSMLLNLVPNGRYIDCEIFNSGEGLQYHKLDVQTNKRHLIKKIRIPKQSLTDSVLHKLLNFEQFDHIRQAYEIFFKIDGVNVPLTPEESVLKKDASTKDNCDAKRIFAFLAQKLPRDVYLQLRKKLFQDCFNAVQEHNDPTILRHERVQYKMNKLFNMHFIPFNKNNV